MESEINGNSGRGLPSYLSDSGKPPLQPGIGSALRRLGLITIPFRAGGVFLWQS
jgi:hypothetical protein